jgi:tetratricopeptide (TPR) repeat protein
VHRTEVASIGDHRVRAPSREARQPVNTTGESIFAEEFAIDYPTYAVGEPEKHPLFFEKRVYQGSNGKIYPLPFIDKVANVPIVRSYRAIRLENDYVRVLLLPEFGGRIHAIQDKTNRDYDIFYHHKVIKPALVGLAGPWISGGVEFNWPQHHRPGTFLPADWAIDRSDDGSVTVWMSEHDPLNRLKGMHGIRLTPRSSLVELRVQLFNRTPYLQTFLWWANAAVKVHDDYQSFFPPDVYYVADHAKRAISSFPIASDHYYGVDYGSRPGGNDLTFYKNIPVPTSYMVVESRYGFFGGFDYRASGGFVHVADRLVVPGKKQWTWGNAAFGRAWDRELSDDSAPYIELMGGAYTDNQPDFSYLQPYETKMFSQFWWPIQGIGVVQNATQNAAIRFVQDESGRYEVGLAVPRKIEQARLLIRGSNGLYIEKSITLAPGGCWKEKIEKPIGAVVEHLELLDKFGRELVGYKPEKGPAEARLPSPAKEPLEPAGIASSDELFLVGEHLEQYRHPTRDPESYWNEALLRDPDDYRSRVALARRCIARFEYGLAVEHLRSAVQRLTTFHPNPVTGEAHYYLGIALRFSDNDELAEEAFGKAGWDRSWLRPAKYELALLSCRRKNLASALSHLDAFQFEIKDNSYSAVLRAIIAGVERDFETGRKILKEVLRLDPLDHWASYELARQSPGQSFATFLARCRNDAQTILDLAFNYIEAGLLQVAIELVELHEASAVTAAATPNPSARTIMTKFVLAWLYAQTRANSRSASYLREAQQADPSYFFPSRGLEAQILEWAIAQSGSRRNAAYGLGNLYYDRRRHVDAIRVWELGIEDDPRFAPLYRNLGLAYWNKEREPLKASRAYERAVELAPDDGRLAYERDQLRKRMNDSPEARLASLEARLDLVLSRDDFCVEYLLLLNLAGRHEEALQLLVKRRFHPWEGGEGKVLTQYQFAHVSLGRQQLAKGNAAIALERFDSASRPPANLGEEFHYLQAKADLNYWRGRALSLLGRRKEAEEAYTASANEAQDFREMTVAFHSPFTYYRGLSLLALGEDRKAQQLFSTLRQHAEELKRRSAKIDYFATSLPNMLVFEEDLAQRNQIEGLYLEGLALLGSGDHQEARSRFLQVISLDSSHLAAKQQLQMWDNLVS